MKYQGKSTKATLCTSLKGLDALKLEIMIYRDDKYMVYNISYE